MRRTQPSIAMSRLPACHQGCFQGSLFRISSVVLTGVKTAAIRFSHQRLFSYTTARACLAARVMMLRAAAAHAGAFLAAASISTFSLLTGMPSILRRGAECACRCDLKHYSILTPCAISDCMCHGYQRVINFIKCSPGNTDGGHGGPPHY